MKLLCGATVSSSRQAGDLPQNMGFVESPSVFAEQPEFTLPAWCRSRFYRVSCRSESRTIASLIDSSRSIREEFYRVFSRRCSAFNEFGVQEVSLNFEWEMIFSDTEYQNKIQEILHCCFGIIHRYGLIPVFELRIPGIISQNPVEFLKFRRSLLYPVRTLIDLHPHEPGALETMQDISRVLKFECNNFRISFDAAGGNYLSCGLMEKVIACITPVRGENPRICFNPGRSAEKDAFEALNTVMM